MDFFFSLQVCPKPELSGQHFQIKDFKMKQLFFFVAS